MTTGYVLCTYLLPDFGKITETTFRGKALRLNRGFVLLPVWFISGTLAVTWTTYLLAYLFQHAASPLASANIISMSVFSLVSGLGIYLRTGRRQELYEMQRLSKLMKKSGQTKEMQAGSKSDALSHKQEKGLSQESLQGFKRVTGWCRTQFSMLTAGEVVFIAAVIALVGRLMWRTFFVSEGTLYVGLSVFSDFAPHLGMIRSFSLGNNFPTAYSHYAGEDIRYHFMFQFLAGNLEFLGLRLDWAFNLPSALSLISVFLLLYVLAVRLSGSRMAGYLSALFFAFRCSPSFFSYLAEIPKGTSVGDALRANIGFIGYTTHEDWGLWNLNVYCNQRHLAFGICALLLVIHLFIPHLYAMAERWKQIQPEENGMQQNNEGFFATAGTFLKFSLFSAEGWKAESYLRPVVLGILLGLTAFWNGATLLATIMVLFMLAVVSDRRVEYLITAIITTVLSLVQNNFFMEGLAVGGAKFQFGFIAENTTLFGTLDYIVRLTGILFLVLFVAFAVVKGVRRWILVAFSAPFVFSFLVSLTIDVTVNHKYIMVSIMLMNIFAAILLVKLFAMKNTMIRILCCGLVVLMTITGFYDFNMVMKRNHPDYNLKFSMEDPLVEWIDENTTSQDVFLTPYYALSRAVMGGAMLFEGHGYYPMTAGYDTNKRYALTREMYEASSVRELQGLIEENGIDYIIIDIDARQSMDYELNEAVFDAAYEKVYVEGDGEWMLSIYDTSKPL